MVSNSGLASPVQPTTSARSLAPARMSNIYQLQEPLRLGVQKIYSICAINSTSCKAERCWLTFRSRICFRGIQHLSCGAATVPTHRDLRHDGGEATQQSIQVPSGYVKIAIENDDL